MTNTNLTHAETFKNAFAPLVNSGFAKIFRLPQDANKDALVFVSQDALLGLGRLVSNSAGHDQMVVFTPANDQWVASVELNDLYVALSDYFEAQQDDGAHHFLEHSFLNFYDEIATPARLNWSGAHSSKVVTRPIANTVHVKYYLAVTATNPADALRNLQRASREYFLQLVSAVKARTAQN